MITNRREFFKLAGSALAAGAVLASPVSSALAAIDPRAKIWELLDEARRLNEVSYASDAFIKASDTFMEHIMDYCTPITDTPALRAEVKEIFRLGYSNIETCSRNGFGIAIVRQALAHYRLPFEPSRMKHWGRWSVAYQHLILSA